MKGSLRAITATAALFAIGVAGCKGPDPAAEAPPPGTPATGSAQAPGIPKQGGANAGMEAPVAAPSSVETGNYAGGRK
jgi:hypothetical protein